MKHAVMNILVRTKIIRWLVEEKAVAFTEAALMLPVFVSLMMGVYDLGQGITTNQKLIGASQIMGDLIARNRSITMSDLNDIIVAGELALDPYDKAPFGYDIASVAFDESGNPEVVWRVTRNAEENDEAIESTEFLGSPGDGILVVTAVYQFRPFFSNFVLNEINMREVAFLRGRRSATVECPDCPG